MPSAKRRPLHNYRTLVLNADGRPLSSWPLSLIDARDAVHAQFRDRIAVVETWPDAFFRSPSVAVPVPKVVMLREYAHVTGEPKFCRRSILLRDRFCCQYCGERFPTSELTYDHVVPRARGGRTAWENVVSCCVPCNKRKRDSLPAWSGRRGVPGSLRPLKEPRRPSNAELARAGLELIPNDVREDFGSWLYWTAELRV